MSSKGLEIKTRGSGLKVNTTESTSLQKFNIHISMKEMLRAGVHVGKQVRYWNPKMKPYIFGTRNKAHIINLGKTVWLFNQALEYLSGLASRNGKILFVGTKREVSNAMKDAAMECGQFYVDKRWLGGMLVNWKTVRQSIRRLKELEQQSQDGTFSNLTRKEVLMLQREMRKLESTLGGIKGMGGLPDCIFVIDADYEKIAVTEARNLGIPVVGVVNTNSNPDGIDYIIPGNNNAISAITLYTKAVARAINHGRGRNIDVTGEPVDFLLQDEASSHPHSDEDSVLLDMEYMAFEEELLFLSKPYIVSVADKNLMTDQIKSLYEQSPVQAIELKFSLPNSISVRKFESLLENFSEKELTLKLRNKDALDVIPISNIALVGIHFDTQEQFSFGQYVEVRNGKVITKPKYLDFIDSYSKTNQLDMANTKVINFRFHIIVLGVIL
tara:strand:+ start:1976 stop:3298 length:1323 start_codon:yes stop_codon:yes gene_type:complete